jgi:hypothetical protein
MSRTIKNIYTPIVQDGFSYDIIHDQLYEQYKVGVGADITVTNGVASILIGTGLYEYALLRSKEIIKYRTGYPIVVRFSAKFDTPVASSLQMSGVGTSTNDIYIGYNGLDLVARVSTDGAHDIRILTITTGSAGNETFTLTLNDTVYNGTITNETIEFNNHEIQIANTYTGFSVQAIEDTIVFVSNNVGSVTGTFSFSSTGSAVGVFTQKAVGVAMTTTTFTSNTWNGDPSAIRRLNPQSWNMYEIEYGWFGVSNIVFRLFNEYTNVYDILHEIRFTNAPNAHVGLSNPSMYIQRFVASLGSTTALTLQTASVFAGMIGTVDGLVLPRYSIEHNKDIIANTETVLLLIAHSNVMGTYIANDEIDIKHLSLASEGTKSVHVKLYKNVTTLSADIITDYQNYKYTDPCSITLYDTTTNTSTGGVLVDTYILTGTSTINNTYKRKELFLEYKECIVITAYSEANSHVDVAITVNEDV